MDTKDNAFDVIKKRASAASPGPWEYHDNGFDGIVRDATGTMILGGEPCEGRVEGDDPNIVFITHAREDVPYLLSEVDRLNSQVEAFERAIRAFECSTGVFSFACFCCIYKGLNDGNFCELLGDEVCEDMENWQFDQQRFAERVALE